MIILGDLAVPNAKYIGNISKAIEFAGWSKNQSIIFNMEGLLSTDEPLKESKPILFNVESMLELFLEYNVTVAALANNHTLDLPHQLLNTKQRLREFGYLSVGAGNVTDKDFELVSYLEDGFKVFVINACWEFLLYHQNNNDNNLQVNTINAERLLKRVSELKANEPIAKIICYFHWSYDLEILPSPSYRVFSKDLIDAGANLIVGTHSHCIQGAESYKDGYIVYGIGNFFLPSKVFANGKLQFPKMSEEGIAIEWNLESNELRCHNFRVDYNSDISYLNYEKSEKFHNSTLILDKSPFVGMANEEFLKYFAKNRRKRMLVPIFKNFNHSFENKIKLHFLKIRAKVARYLAESRIIKWQN